MTVQARLPAHLAGIYGVLVVYASLHPLTGWRALGGEPFAFLTAGWPRYFTLFDLAANLLAYLPLGFLTTAALSQRLPARWAAFLASVGAAALSGTIETLQNFLPSRVPSNLDLVCNALGGALGALAGMRWGRLLHEGGRLQCWRERYVLAGAAGERGLVLMGLWLLAQLNPETFLFGQGNLRSLFGLPAPLAFAAAQFKELETATVAAQTLAVTLIADRLAVRRRWLWPFVWLGLALAVRAGGLTLLLQDAPGLAWLSPGTLAGLGLGLVLYAVFVLGSPAIRRLAAALALMLATILANLMPDNPYLADSLRIWQQGHFLNFNGLTRLISALWPFLALAWLMFSRRRHARPDS